MVVAGDVEFTQAHELIANFEWILTGIDTISISRHGDGSQLSLFCGCLFNSINLSALILRYTFVQKGNYDNLGAN